MSNNWTIDRETIIKAVETLGLVPSRPGIVTSEFICVKPKKNKIRMLMASEISGFVEVKGEGNWPFEKDVYLDRRLMDPFIIAAKNIKSKANFVFTKTGKKELTITNGTRKAKLTCAAPKSGYAEIKTSGGREVKAEKSFNILLTAAKYCAETETANPERNAIFVKRDGNNNVVLYATTGLIMFKAMVKSKLKVNEPIPFPLYIVELFSNQTLVGIETTNHDVVLDFGNGKVWQTIAVAAKKKFPYRDIDKYMKKESKESQPAFSIDVKSFGNKVGMLAGYLGSVRRLDWILNLKGEKDTNKLELTVPLGHTVFRDKVSTSKTITKSFNVDLPLDRLLGVIGVITNIGGKLKWSLDKDNRSYVRAENIELLITRRTN